MKLEDINIRDPFVLNDGGVYYLYGTRAKDFGCNTGGLTFIHQPTLLIGASLRNASKRRIRLKP